MDATTGYSSNCFVYSDIMRVRIKGVHRSTFRISKTPYTLKASRTKRLLTRCWDSLVPNGITTCGYVLIRCQNVPKKAAIFILFQWVLLLVFTSSAGLTQWKNGVNINHLELSLSNRSCSNKTRAQTKTLFLLSFRTTTARNLSSTLW